jgi:hypothetical protein
MASVLAFILTPLGRILAGAGGALLILFAFAEWNQAKGKRELLADSKQEGQEINETNAKVRAAVERPGAAGRVRKEFCRDC